MRAKFYDSTPTTVASRIGATVFLALVLAFGVGFLFLMGRDLVQTFQRRQWPATPCVIQSSAVNNQSNDYVLHVVYRYTAEGHQHVNGRVAATKVTSSDYSNLQRQLLQYPPGGSSVCYVNPANPADAVLRRGDFWIIPFAIIPLVFVAIGGVGIYGTWRPKRAIVQPSASPVSDMVTTGQSMSPSLTPKAAKRSTMFLFAIFFLIGGLLFYLMTVRTLLGISAARNWSSIPCVVISSRVQSHSGNKGTTYSIDILYAYTFNGHEYRSNRYNFMSGSSSGHDGKARVVSLFPPGRHATCYVDPLDPTSAVLDRGYSSDMLFGLIPLVFLLIGTAGLIGLWVRRNNAAGFPR